MKKIFLIMILAVMANEILAQKVYKSGNAFIIECEGMPAESYTKTAKPRTTAATNTTASTSTGNDLSLWKENVRVSYKFEVSGSYDFHLDGRDYVSWRDAYDVCTNKAGGNWRLPTQSESQLIFIMQKELGKLSGFEMMTEGTIWTATEMGSYWNTSTTPGGTAAWTLYVGNNGYTGGISKDYGVRVRCIRDITN